jgi:hypothetical protein
MTPNLIRDCDALCDRLQDLGAADQLNPEMAGILCRRMVGLLGEIAIWTQASASCALTEKVELLIQRMTLRISDLHRAASAGRLTAQVFERICFDLKVGLLALQEWADSAVAPRRVRPLCLGLSPDQARIPVIVYDRGPRRFAVIQGGRS